MILVNSLKKYRKYFRWLQYNWVLLNSKDPKGILRMGFIYGGSQSYYLYRVIRIDERKFADPSRFWEKNQECQPSIVSIVTNDWT